MCGINTSCVTNGKPFECIADQIDNIKKTILVGEINYNDSDFLSNNTRVFTKTVSGVKPSGYIVLDGYVDIVDVFTNSGDSKMAFSMNISGGDQNSVGRKQSMLGALHNIGNPNQTTLDACPLIPTQLQEGAISTTLKTRTINIDSDVDVTLYVASDLAMDSGDFTSGKVKFYIIVSEV